MMFSCQVNVTQNMPWWHNGNCTVNAEASKQFQLMPLETEDNVFQAQLLNSFRAEVHVPLEWPNGDGATLRSLWNGDTRVDLGDNFEQLGDTARDTDLSRGSLPAFLHAVAAAAVAACQ